MYPHERVFAAMLFAATSLVANAINSPWIDLTASAEAADSTAVADPHAVQPERPTLATHAHTVAPGWVEIEAGIEHDRFADRAQIESAVSTIKLGLSRRTQLGVTTSVLRDPTDAAHTSGLGDLSLALKWRLLDAAPWLGDFALLPVFKLPTGSSAHGAGTGTTDASLYLVSSHSFGHVSLDLNAGATVRSGNGSIAPTRASLWTAALGLPVDGSVGWAAEVYGLPGTSGRGGAAPIIAVLFGPTWTPRPWLELDAGAIVPLSGPQPHALYAGLVWNVGKLWAMGSLVHLACTNGSFCLA